MTFSRLPESLSEGSGLWVTIPVMVLRPPYTKVAISLPSLLRQTNAFSVKRRPGCEARLKRSRPKELFLEYNVTCHEKDSDPAGHDVQVQFNLEDVEKTQDAKRLDVRCSCSCPAFLYWGQQWNLHQRDALLGEPRPLLKAPEERLDLRANAIICKHAKTVFEKILPAVQHNIVNIVREKEVEKNKERLEEQPPSPKEKKLQERQEEMRKRKEIEEIVKTKDEDEQKRMIDELLEEEEKKLKKPVEEPEAPEAPSPEPPLARPPRPAPAPAPPKQNVVQRDEPAATPPPPAPTPAAPEKPDLADLIRKEEKRLQKGEPRKPAFEETLKRKRTSLEASLLEKLTSDKLQRWDSLKRHILFTLPCKFSDKEAVKKLSSFDRTDSRSFLKSVEVSGQAFLNKTAEELYVVRRGDGVTLTDPATKDECARWVHQHGAEAGVVGGNFLNLAIEEARPGESRWMPQFTEDDLEFMDQLKISAVVPLARPGQDIQVLQRSDTWLDLVKAKQQRERLASPEEAEQSLAKDILRQFPSHKVALGMLATMCEMNDRNWPDQDYLYTREGDEVGTEDFEIALDLSLHDLRYRPDNWAGTAKKLLTAALRRWTPKEMEREASLYEGYDGCQSDDSSPGFGYAKDFNWSQVDEFPVSRIEKGSGIRWKGEWKRYREEPYYKDMEKWWTKKPNEHVIIVRGNDGKYYIWDGYHRTAIAKSHGMKSVPAFVGTSKEGKTASSPVEKD